MYHCLLCLRPIKNNLKVENTKKQRLYSFENRSRFNCVLKHFFGCLYFVGN